VKRFNVGIVGYGWAAGAHITAINRGKRGQVTAICSSRVLDPKELSAQHGCELKTYTNLHAMLTEPDLHVLDVCSYHEQHPAQIIAGAKAGKHIIAEKPLVLSLTDLRAIEKAVRAAGVNFCVCFELRYSSQFLETKALIDQGKLGRLHYAEIDYYHGIGPWYREYEWVTTNKACGSSLLAAGCHSLDALLMCMGGDVEEVFCYGVNSSHPIFAKYEYPTSTVTILKFKDGRVGKCASVIDCFQPYYFHTHLVGSEGSVLDNKLQSNLQSTSGHNNWTQLSFKPVDSGDVADHPYKTQFDAFFESIERSQPMAMTGLADAVRTHEVIFAAERSLKESRPVRMAEILAQ